MSDDLKGRFKERIGVGGNDYVKGCNFTLPQIIQSPPESSLSPTTTPAPNPDLAQVPVGVVVGAFIAFVLIAVVVVRVRRTSRNGKPTYQTPIEFANHQKPFPPVPEVEPSTFIQIQKELPLLGYTLIPSLALDDVDALYDQIHRFASTILTMFPKANFWSQSLDLNYTDNRATNLSALKRIFAQVLTAEVFSYFNDAYSFSHESGMMQVEPETVYYALLKLADSKPTTLERIPDRKVSECVERCTTKILSKLDETIKVDEKIAEAVAIISSSSTLVVIKLKAIDSSYSPYISSAGEPFDESRMRASDSGKTVVFAESCGWEKKRNDSNLVKIPAYVRVEYH
ncbi:hypothetical protein HK098_002694 [Nowakowskiella sp. JEL0407]|nr:hypothetical protein HK098_002694 [Nowakowskiella sp. JEL0407]